MRVYENNNTQAQRAPRCLQQLQSVQLDMNFGYNS